MPRFVIVMLGVLCALSLAWGTPPATLQATLNHQLQESTPRNASVGVFIQSLDNGDIWYTHDADSLYVPASNAKIVTSVLALEYLKPEYCFTTRLLTNGTRTGDTLEGDLYLKGGGDPSLTSADLQSMVQLLVAGDEEQNIPPLKKITGKLILDSSFFPSCEPLLGKGWEKSDLPWYYAAPSSALSVNRNALMITVRGGRAGKPAEVTLDPPTALFTIDNETRTSTKVKTGAVDMTRSGKIVRITGKVAPGAEFSEKLSMPQPCDYLAEQFLQALKQNGVQIGTSQTVTTDPPNLQVLVQHNSAPLSELIVTMLKESDNHYAEQLYWTLLSLYSLEKPIDQRYMAMLQDFFAHSGSTIWGMQMVDGSGLSRLNKISPAALAHLLAYMKTTPSFDAFYQALPIAGEDGTMKNRLCKSPATGNMHAKTGTMRGISTLSGYLTTAGGEHLAFSIMVNGYTNKAAVARKLQDEIVDYLAGLP